MTVTTLMVKAEMMSVMVSIEDGIVLRIVLQLMSVTLSLWMEFTLQAQKAVMMATL